MFVSFGPFGTVISLNTIKTRTVADIDQLTILISLSLFCFYVCTLILSTKYIKGLYEKGVMNKCLAPRNSCNGLRDIHDV